MQIQVTRASSTDKSAIVDVIELAFPGVQGREIATLFDELIVDPSAEPAISLIAKIDSKVVGHVLLTCARIEGHPIGVSASILAPLSVHPMHQGRGVGRLLVERGLQVSRDAGFPLMFVLGHPAYYQRFGFSPAGVRGFDAPFPIPAQHADAWMFQELSPDISRSVRGRVICADSLNDPKHWIE
jgi:predicted N-acetyltransferase YhbS